MTAKTLIVAALLTAGGLARASDVSYDQARIRSESATLVEGALHPRPAKRRAPAETCGCSQVSAPAPATQVRAARGPANAPSAS